MISPQKNHISRETVVRIAHATGHTVGWLLDERGFTLGPDEVKTLRKVVPVLQRLTETEESS